MSRRHLVFAIPGDLDRLSGGTIYDRRLAAGLAARGWRVALLRLGDSFPFPTAVDLAEAASRLGELPDGALVLTDGLAFGAMPEVVHRERMRLRLVALVHHPLAYETGLDDRQVDTLLLSERRALAAACAVLVPSAAMRDALVSDFGVPSERIAVAMPGTEPAPLARGSGEPDVQLLAVGAVIARKCFTDLVLALSRLRDLPWRLAIAGSLERSAEAVQALRTAIAANGLGERITLMGELRGQALAAAYDRADLLVSASAYEGFGMALAEGLARGSPIVAVAGGAVASWLDREAAILVPPGDTKALSEALRRVITDPALRTSLRTGASAARERLPDWNETATIAEGLLLSVSAA